MVYYMHSVGFDELVKPYIYRFAFINESSFSD